MPCVSVYLEALTLPRLIHSSSQWPSMDTAFISAPQGWKRWRGRPCRWIEPSLPSPVPLQLHYRHLTQKAAQPRGVSPALHTPRVLRGLPKRQAPSRSVNWDHEAPREGRLEGIMGEVPEPGIPYEVALSPCQHMSFFHLLARNRNNSHS